MASPDEFWPASVPRSLWQYGLLAPEDRRAFPFVGIHVTWEFAAAFVVGVALICAFAWRRFSEPSYDVNAQAFSDFKELPIWNLRDSVSLRRAYMVYCVSLVAIYGTLAFFGRVIVELFNRFKVSGLEINVGTVQFDTWQWPFALALGIAGFAPLINPLVPAELWLRRFSHGAVGIPTRLRETAVRIRTLLDGEPTGTLMSAPDWVEAALGPKLDGCTVLNDNLKLIVGWSYHQHIVWSDPEIRWKLNEYERGVRDKTEDATAEFDYLMKQQRPSQGNPADRRNQLRAFEKRLTHCTATLEAQRDRFALIIAIYRESGSRRFATMKDSDLKSNLGNFFAPPREMAGTGMPLYGFLLVFIAYFVAVSFGWHPLISAVPNTKATAITTAAVETLKVFLLVWLPVTAVATFRSVMDRPGSVQEQGMLWGTVPGAVTSLVVAAFGMSLFALLYSALPAETVTQMQETLLGRGTFDGALVYFLLFSPVAVFGFLGVDSVRTARPRMKFGRRLVRAAVATATTVVWLGFVVSHSPGQGICYEAEGVPLKIWQVLQPTGKAFQACFTYYSTLDIVVIALAVLCSVLALGTWRRGAAVALVFLTVSVILLMSARADGAERSAPVNLGFREDVPPFSWRPEGHRGPDVPYKGYVAELCYEMFEDSGYVTKAVSVDVTNRFDVMRRPGEAAATRDDGSEPVDVLCDVTTVRVERTKDGIFSPIVFVSGVSYLQRSGGVFGKVEIGYAKSSTSERVAEEACTVDFLRLGSVEKSPRCFQRALPSDCRAAAPQERKEKQAKPATLTLEDFANTRNRDYVLCPMATHDKLIEWFCGDSGRDKVYIGDRDVVLGQRDEWLAKGRTCPGIRDSNQTFTYEPYALLVSKADPELVAFVQRRVYELFSHRAGAEALFYKWFGQGTRMSEPLAWLFVLNGVRYEGEVLNGTKGFPVIRDRCLRGPMKGCD